MATATQWLSASRPRTLPAAVAPVLVGAGAAAAIDLFSWWRSLLALIVSLALQVGVNYANDYSDGVRGTDNDRVGPLRLVGSGLAEPRAVKAAAFCCFGVAGIAGLILAAVTTWWLLPFGVAAVVAAWFYTGGPKPYGYAGFGELFVFAFFGLMAVLGTTYVNSGHISSLRGGRHRRRAPGLRAADGQQPARRPDRRPHPANEPWPFCWASRLTRTVLVLTIGGAYLAVLVIGLRQPWCLLAPLGRRFGPPAGPAGAGGPGQGSALITALGGTGRLEFVYAVLLTLGLVLGGIARDGLPEPPRTRRVQNRFRRGPCPLCTSPLRTADLRRRAVDARHRALHPGGCRIGRAGRDGGGRGGRCGARAAPDFLT